MKNNKGFTLLELMIVIFILFGVLWGGVISAGLMGNQWYLESGVLRKIQLDHPAVTEIVDTQRNVWRHSVITVKENGVDKKYHLDADIFFNYEIVEENE